MIAAVVTTRNEVLSIGCLVRDLKAQTNLVIVVDEDSTDDTRTVAFSNGAVVYRAEGGIGACQRYGYARALEAGADRIVQIDAGGSHDPNAISSLLCSDAELIIGSRFVPDGQHHGAWWRRVGSRTYASLLGNGISDWTSGYRVMSAEVAKHLVDQEYRCRMHGWQAEALRHALDGGFTVEEVPITYRPSRSSLSWGVVREALGVLAR